MRFITALVDFAKREDKLGRRRGRLPGAHTSSLTLNALFYYTALNLLRSRVHFVYFEIFLPHDNPRDAAAPILSFITF